MSEHDTTPWRNDIDHYRQIGDMFAVIAESHYGVVIDSVTRARWQEMMPLIGEVDTYVDERIVPGLNTEQDLVDELESFHRFRGRYPHLAPDVLGESRWRAMERVARRAVDAFVSLSQVTTYEEYVYFRRSEGEDTAELFAVCASDKVAMSPAFTKGFLPAFKQMVVSGCLVDSAGDLPQDVKEGKALLAPTLTNRTRLLFDAAKIGVEHLAIVRHRSVRQALGRTATQYFERHR